MHKGKNVIAPIQETKQRNPDPHFEIILLEKIEGLPSKLSETCVNMDLEFLQMYVTPVNSVACHYCPNIEHLLQDDNRDILEDFTNREAEQRCETKEQER